MSEATTAPTPEAALAWEAAGTLRLVLAAPDGT